MQTKKVIQRALPLDVKYNLLGVSYLSIENGGGCSCNNCGKLITNVAEVKSINGVYSIGLDCLDTVLINNDLLDGEDYVNYLFSDKPAIQKAKSLRAKIIKYSKSDVNFKATFRQFDNGFGFSYETKGRFSEFEPIGYDYTFNDKYKELTLNYIKGLPNVFFNS